MKTNYLGHGYDTLLALAQPVVRCQNAPRGL